MVLWRWHIERVDFSLLRTHDAIKLVNRVLASVDEPLVLFVLPVAQPFLTHLFFHDTSAYFELVVFLKYLIQIFDFTLVFYSGFLSRRSLSGIILTPHFMNRPVFTVILLSIIICLLVLFPGNFVVFCVDDAISILLIGPVLLVIFLYRYLIFQLLNMWSYGLWIAKLVNTLNMTLLYLYWIEDVNISIYYRNFVPVFKFLLSLKRCQILLLLHFSQYVGRRVRKLLH